MLTDQDVDLRGSAIMHWTAGYTASLLDRSRLITHFLERRMAAVCIAWLVVACALALFRLSSPASAIHDLADAAPILLAYSLIVLAPILGYLVGRHAFTGSA